MKWRFTQRFIAEHVTYSGDECLIWPFGRDSQGYGRATMPGHTTRLAHRIMLALAKGEPPEGQTVARHICGMGHLGCVNPNHLSWGTPMDNTQDSRIHGTIARGETRSISKLKTDDILAIRALRRAGLTHDAIARKFEVHTATIQAVLNGRTWGHVQ